MSLLGVTIYLSCLMLSLVNGETMFKQYCYDPYDQSCEEHILDCPEGEVITTDVASFRVSYYKNGNTPECQTEKDECKNKTTCCRFISTTTTSTFTADDNTKPINFIKTECSSKSSCKVSLYRIGFQHDFINYTYGCVSQDKVVDFVVNGSTKFTGNSSVFYVEYVGNGTKEDNETVLNRECIVTTTAKAINLTTRALNLQADDCCRFYISGHNVSEYCSQSGSFIPFKGKSIVNNTATIRLLNVVNKDGDSFLILVTAAGNVTIDCRTIDSNQEPISCQYPTPEPSTISSSSLTAVPSTNIIPTILSMKKDSRMEDSETSLAVIIGGTVGGLVVLVLIIIVVVVIMRRRRRLKDKVVDDYPTVDDNPKHKPEDNPKGNSKYAYIDIDLDKVGYTTIPNNNSGNQVEVSGDKDNNPKEVNKTHPIFKRQDFSFVEGKFGRYNESKDDKKLNEKANLERKGEIETADYTYIDDYMLKNPSGVAAKDNGQQGVPQYAKVNKKHGKFIPSNDKSAVNLDNYNHIGLNEAPSRVREQDSDDTYNHIDSNIKNGNSLTKVSNSKPSSNYTYTEIDLPQEDDYDDTYDHAQQGGERILKQKNTMEQNASDTYNHIGTNNDNSLSGAVSDNYNHIGVDNALAKGGNSDLDTYNHIGVDNAMTKGSNSDLDTYNHIGVDNEVAKGTNSDLDTYNHIGVDNAISVSSRARAVPDTYNHIRFQ